MIRDTNHYFFEYEILNLSDLEVKTVYHTITSSVDTSFIEKNKVELLAPFQDDDSQLKILNYLSDVMVNGQ